VLTSIYPKKLGEEWGSPPERFTLSRTHFPCQVYTGHSTDWGKLALCKFIITQIFFCDNSPGGCFSMEKNDGVGAGVLEHSIGGGII
jgi:hypothetical protein